jgi:transcriptional regulator with XRE-family HTH domain
MLSRFDLQEYRLMRHLSLRDVARYCDVCHELIGQVERGEVGVTQYNHDQIVQGINKASQAIVDGTFNELKEKECQKIKEEREKLKAKKEASSKTITAKKTTTRKSVKADTKK